MGKKSSQNMKVANNKNSGTERTVRNDEQNSTDDQNERIQSSYFKFFFAFYHRSTIMERKGTGPVLFGRLFFFLSLSLSLTTNIKSMIHLFIQKNFTHSKNTDK